MTENIPVLESEHAASSHPDKFVDVEITGTCDVTPNEPLSDSVLGAPQQPVVVVIHTISTGPHS